MTARAERFALDPLLPHQRELEQYGALQGREVVVGDQRQAAHDGRQRHQRDEGQRRGFEGGQHGVAGIVDSGAMSALPASVEDVSAGLRAAGYLPGESTALVSYLASRLGKPVLVEGPAGVGKTELAKALSRYLDRRLVRLQCYEGLDEAKALYEWNYRKQLLRIQAEAAGTGWDAPSSITRSVNPGVGVVHLSDLTSFLELSPMLVKRLRRV